jgi:hypothetical protein
MLRFQSLVCRQLHREVDLKRYLYKNWSPNKVGIPLGETRKKNVCERSHKGWIN